MAVEFQDAIKADLVLVGLGLLGQPSEFESFKQVVRTDVTVGHSMVIDAQTNVTEPGRAISLNRDRIILEASPFRSTIRRDYPELRDLDRLAEVAGHAISLTENVNGLRAFGYNLEIVYDQTSEPTAQLYLATRLLAGQLPYRDTWKLIGGAARAIYAEGDNQWQISLEPRFNDPSTTKIFLQLNLHKDETSPPAEHEIRTSLHQAWEQAQDFAHRLDEMVR